MVENKHEAAHLTTLSGVWLFAFWEGFMDDKIEEMKEKSYEMFNFAYKEADYEAMARLATAYSSLVQAQKNCLTPTVEFSEKGISYGYAEPTVYRFNNEIKK